MVSNIIDKVNGAFNIAVVFFLLTGSLSVIYYLLQSGKIIYLFFSFIIYFFSFILRKKLFKVENNKGFTEVGLFFISFLFLGYLLNILKLDSGIRSYFPDKVLINSGVSFIFLFFMYLISSFNQGKLKFINIIVLLTVLFLLQKNQDYINFLFSNNRWISEFIIGTPVVYLGLLLSGLKDYVVKKS